MSKLLAFFKYLHVNIIEIYATISMYRAHPVSEVAKHRESELIGESLRIRMIAHSNVVSSQHDIYHVVYIRIKYHLQKK